MKSLLLTAIVWSAAIAVVFGQRLLFPLVLAVTAVITEALKPEPQPVVASVPVVIEAPTPPATAAPKKKKWVTRKRVSSTAKPKQVESAK